MEARVINLGAIISDNLSDTITRVELNLLNLLPGNKFHTVPEGWTANPYPQINSGRRLSFSRYPTVTTKPERWASPLK